MWEHVNLELVPQESNNLPPFRNLFPYLLVLRSSLERFHQRNLGKWHDLRLLNKLPDSICSQYERNIANAKSAESTSSDDKLNLQV